jgi:hypothetical protein
MSKPCGSLLLTTDQSHPITTTTTTSLPDIGIPIHPPCLTRFLERRTGSSADAMSKRLVVPESTVFQHKPSSRLADTTPSFTLVAMSSYPAWSVQVSWEAKFLFVWNHVRIFWVHVLWWWLKLILAQGAIEIWWIREVGVVRMQGMWIGVAL